MKQELTEDQLKLVSGGAAEDRYETSRESHEDVEKYNGRGGGYYIITHPDGSEEIVEF